VYTSLILGVYVKRELDYKSSPARADLQSVHKQLTHFFEHSRFSAEHFCLSTEHSCLSAEHSCLSVEHSCFSTEYSHLSAENSRLSGELSCFRAPFITFSVNSIAFEPHFITYKFSLCTLSLEQILIPFKLNLKIKVAIINLR